MQATELNRDSGTTWANYFAVGLATGIRTSMGITVVTGLSVGAWQGTTVLDVLGRFLTQGWIQLLMRVGVGVELVGDKMSAAPSRLRPTGLSARLLAAMVTGALLARRTRGNPLMGALVAMVGAFAGAHAGYWYRVYLGKRIPVPGIALAVLEDLTAFAVARSGTRWR